MRIDASALALRVTLAWFLFTVTILALFLVGSAQTFLEPTLKWLFDGVRWLSWGGVLVSLLVLTPTTGKIRGRRFASIALGLGFGVLFAFVLVWGSWIYPEAGILPW